MKRVAQLFILWLAFSLPAMATDLFSVSSTLKSSDPTQLGRLSRSGVPSDWSATKAFPGICIDVLPLRGFPNVASSTFVRSL